jgi:voltage-gated potassium channel
MFTAIIKILADHQKRHVLLLTLIVIGTVAIGGSVFALVDHIPITTGLYWAVVTATTVGYGDVTPVNPAGRVVAVVVMLISIPSLAGIFALLTGSSISKGIKRLLSMNEHFPAKPYTLVLGSHRSMPAVLEELLKAGEQVVLVADMDGSDIRHGVYLVSGDPTEVEVLRKAKPAEAKQALIMADKDAETLLIAVLLKEEAPQLTISATVKSSSVRDALKGLGAHLLISEDEILAHTLAKSIETPHAADLMLALVASDDVFLDEVEMGAEDAGLSMKEAERKYLKAGKPMALVTEERLYLGIESNPVVRAGDKLLLLKKTINVD